MTKMPMSAMTLSQDSSKCNAAKANPAAKKKSPSHSWPMVKVPAIQHTVIGSYRRLARNRFSCLRCAKSFKRVKSLASHMKRVHRSKHFACEICNRKFVSNCQRIWHKMDTHCGRRRRRRRDVDGDSKTTNSFVKNECKPCHLTFKRDYSLKLHNCLSHKMPFHLKAKLISLDDLLEFASIASTSSNSQQSTSSVGSQETITCCRCEETFDCEDNFEKHRRTCILVDDAEREAKEDVTKASFKDVAAPSTTLRIGKCQTLSNSEVASKVSVPIPIPLSQIDN